MAITGGTIVVDVLKTYDGNTTVNVEDILTEADIPNQNHTVFITEFPGVDPTGATDSTSGLVAAMVSGATVVIQKGATILASPVSGLAGYLIVEGVLRLSGTSTVSCTVEVRGGSVEVLSGGSCTFTGSFVAQPTMKIFTGAGNVYGIRHVYPEWWGGKGDGVTDNAPYFAAASACVANSASVLGMRARMELLSGRYLTSATWTIPSSANIGVEVKGQGILFGGTRIVSATGFTGSAVVAIPGLADTTQRIMDFKLSDFGVVPATKGLGALYGIQIGSDSLIIHGLRESHVENVYIEAFSSSLRIVNTRLVKFSRVGIWNDGYPGISNNILIEAIGKFCGDLSFENCQTVNNQAISGSKCILIRSTSQYSTVGETANQVAGIRFTECILYTADQTAYIASLNGAHVDDIFFQNCQWDGDSNSMVYVICDGSGSQVNDIQIRDNFMYGGNKSSSASQIQFIASNSGAVANIRVQSNTLGAGITRAVNTTTSSSGTITGLFILDNNIINFSNGTAAAIEVASGVTRANICNNAANRNAALVYPYLIQVNAGANYYVITGNLGAGIVSSATVNELSPGANRVVANNL